jgi:hypothetical protein
MSTENINYPKKFKTNINFDTTELLKLFRGSNDTSVKSTVPIDNTNAKSFAENFNVHINNKNIERNEKMTDLIDGVDLYPRVLKFTELSVGEIIINTQKALWELFDFIKNKRDLILLLRSDKMIYLSILAIVFGVLLLISSNIF